MGVGAALDHAGHAVDHHQHLPGRRAAQGHRDLDGDRRRRRRARPATGGLLLEHFYWGSIFLVNLPDRRGRAARRRVPHPRLQGPARPATRSSIGAMLSIVGLPSLLYAVIEAPSHGWTDGTILTAFAIGGVVLAAFFAWSVW